MSAVQVEAYSDYMGETIACAIVSDTRLLACWPGGPLQPFDSFGDGPPPIDIPLLQLSPRSIRGLGCAVTLNNSLFIWGAPNYLPTNLRYSQVSCSVLNEEQCGLLLNGTLLCVMSSFLSPPLRWSIDPSQVSAPPPWSRLLMWNNHYEKTTLCGLSSVTSIIECWQCLRNGSSIIVTPLVIGSLSFEWNDIFSVDTNRVGDSGDYLCGILKNETNSIRCYNVTDFVDQKQRTPPNKNTTNEWITACYGNDYGCAINQTGELTIWSTSGEQVSQLLAPPNGPFVSISCADRHVCAIRPTTSLSTVVCFVAHNISDSRSPFFQPSDMATPAFAGSLSPIGYYSTDGIEQYKCTGSFYRPTARGYPASLCAGPCATSYFGSGTTDHCDGLCTPGNSRFPSLQCNGVTTLFVLVK
jgi:hypothetical protein